MRSCSAVALAALLAAIGTSAKAQHAGHSVDDEMSAPWSAGARAVGIVTRAEPALGGRSLTEGYLAQPLVWGRLSAWRSHIDLMTTVQIEGLTLKRGELNTGIYGEGYVDRRHPHTYLHELMGSLNASLGMTRASLSFGKGYVPFGSDDPMMRPFAAFPVNHHLSQILERLIAIGSVRRSVLLLEAATFNGDEPVSPTSAPNARRFADSWSVRATLFPADGAEVAASHADVASPEDRAGNGSRQRKWNVLGRWESPGIRAVHKYALVEWSASDEINRGQRSFRLTSLLGEAEVSARGSAVALRLERSIRPEEERLLDPFRSVFPNADVQILGRTRFSIATVAVRHALPAIGFLGAEPFAEVSMIDAEAVDEPALFVPAEFYGSTRLWNLSVGVRVRAGAMMHRMGRYGAGM
ncbi:MAG: hypothetical protein M3081_16870 [Gemmatimonadota bacterium]|nr:hypothetical protein [Gemmatimonadota bacterium]